jgi:hypothetical protein
VQKEGAIFMTRSFFKFTLAAFLLTFVIGLAIAQPKAHPLEGKYDVTASGDAVGSITFQLILKRNGEAWAGETVNTPIPLTISKVMVEGENKVSLTGDSGGTEVMMTAKVEEGKLKGDWTAGGGGGTWTAIKQGATERKAGSSAGADSVEGAYEAKVVAEGQGELPFTLIIKRDGDKFVTEVKDGGDLNITGITVNGDSVTLDAAYQGNPFPLPGKREGRDMKGKWEAGGFSGTWSAIKKVE